MEVHESGWQKKGDAQRPHVATKVDESVKAKLIILAKEQGITVSALVSSILTNHFSN